MRVPARATILKTIDCYHKDKGGKPLCGHKMDNPRHKLEKKMGKVTCFLCKP